MHYIQHNYNVSCKKYTHGHLTLSTPTCHTSVGVVRDTFNAHTAISTASFGLAHWLSVLTLVIWLAYSNNGSLYMQSGQQYCCFV